MNIIKFIYNEMARHIHLLRAVWTASILLGIFLLIAGFILYKNPKRKKMPWIVGGIGIMMMISAGTQLMFSLF